MSHRHNGIILLCYLLDPAFVLVPCTHSVILRKFGFVFLENEVQTNQKTPTLIPECFIIRSFLNKKLFEVGRLGRQRHVNKHCTFGCFFFFFIT